MLNEVELRTDDSRDRKVKRTLSGRNNYEEKTDFTGWKFIIQ